MASVADPFAEGSKDQVVGRTHVFQKDYSLVRKELNLIMKSKKKLLLLGVGAMSAMALAVGATSTFAWYVTGEAAVNFNAKAADSSITTTATATASAIEVDVVFSISLTDNLEPTKESDGKTYVVRNGVVEVANPQPAGTKQIGDDATITVSHLYYQGQTTNELTPQDARSLRGARYDIKLTAPNEAGGVRLAKSKTPAAAGTVERVENVAAGITIGSVIFDSTNPEDPTKCTFKNSSDSAGLDTFYYSYNPVYGGAAGSSQAESETAGAKTPTITVTLTAHGS